MQEWCKKQKLEISTKKSEMLQMKEFIDIKRPPTTRIGSVTMKMRPVFRYLGIYLGTRMNITPNINYITQESRKLFASLTKLAKEGG